MFKHTMFVAWNLDKTEPRKEPWRIWGRNKRASVYVF